MNDEKLIDALKNATGMTPPKFTPAPQLVRLAEMLTEGVRDGTITSASVIFVGARGEIRWPAFGMQVTELMAGLEFARDDLKANIRGASQKIMKAG